jgi:hypothetical protein
MCFLQALAQRANSLCGFPTILVGNSSVEFPTFLLGLSFADPDTGIS